MIIPISDENPTLRFPLMTVLILIVTGVVWVVVQHAGQEPWLVQSVCDLGLVPGEITGRARVGDAIQVGENLFCVVDAEPINYLTPLTSIFLHGSWMHLLGNCLFLWVFGNNVEDSMGRLRFLVFYLLCGLAAAAAQVLVNPVSPVPMVGASGAISGVMGAYLLLYPRVRVRLLVFVILIFLVRVPAYAALLVWIGLQVVSALPQLNPMRPDVSGGVAVFAHIGGFAAGLLLIRTFRNPELVGDRSYERPRINRERA